MLKKNHTALAVVLMAAATLCFQSCNCTKKGGEGADSLTVEMTSGDTLTFVMAACEDTTSLGDNAISQSIRVQFPLPDAEGPLPDSLRAHLVSSILQHYYPLIGELTEEKDDLPYEVGKEQQFVEACAKAGVKHMEVEVRKAMDEGWAAGYENSYHATLHCQNDRYLTIDESASMYTGGAHGLFCAWGTTFRKSDGRKMGWNLFDMSKKGQIANLIIFELRRYFAFEPDNDPVSEEALFEQLQLWDDPETPQNELEFRIPLPTTDPYVTPEGIAFVYQQYEIAAYACGLPSGTLLFDKVRDVLSEEGRELLGLN